MYAVKIGEKQLKVVNKQDVNALLCVLLDLNCDYRVSYKKLNETEAEAEEDTDIGTNADI